MIKRTTTDAIIELLAETWPQCFSVYERRRKPLKIGIREDLLQQLDGAVTASELGAALRCYCANRVYRSRLYKGAQRFNLNGEGAGVVEENFHPSTHTTRRCDRQKEGL
jgi:sRNA-binding protein